jgi:hypothetical protein
MWMCVCPTVVFLVVFFLPFPSFFCTRFMGSGYGRAQGFGDGDGDGDLIPSLVGLMIAVAHAGSEA